MEEADTGQGTESQINFVCLRAIIDDAIKNKDISAIEAMDNKNKRHEKQLRYMQKYAELKISKDGFSFGIYSFILAILAIGVSYALINTQEIQKAFYPTGVFFIIMALLLLIWWKRKYEPSINFIIQVILKIEEKLSNETPDSETNDKTNKQTN